MKRIICGIAAGLLLAGCAKDESTSVGAAPNNDTGMAEQNTVVNASPETAAGASPTASSGEAGPASAHGAAVNESLSTNNSAKPQHPPLR